MSPRTRSRADRDAFGRSIPENFRITFRRDLLAEALWEYGEDGLCEAALRLTEEQLQDVQLIAVWHQVNDPESVEGPKLSNGRIMARAMIEYAERASRDTVRRRRRTRPDSEKYRLERPDTPTERGLDKHD